MRSGSLVEVEKALLRGCGYREREMVGTELNTMEWIDGSYQSTNPYVLFPITLRQSMLFLH